MRDDAAIARGAAALDSGRVRRAEPPAEVKAARSCRFEFLTINELCARPPIQWRLVRTIPGRGLIVLWGAPGSAKTFVLLDMLIAIARGQPWFGHRVRGPVGVVYIAAEGSLGVRLAAHQRDRCYADEDVSSFRVLESSINLLDPSTDLDDLLVGLRSLRDELGSIGVVAVDTLARAMPGGNDNDSGDMGAMVAAAKRIEQEFDCAFVYVHHTGKDETRGARGHNSLKGAADAELQVRRIGEGSDAVRELVIEKMRDGEAGHVEMSFRLRQVDLGPMRDVDPVANDEERWTSCVIEPIDHVEAVQAPKRRAPTGKNQKLVMQALVRLCSTRGVTPPGLGPFLSVLAVKLDALRDEIAREEFAHMEAKHRSTRLTDAISSLKAEGFVDWRNEYLWVKRPNPQRPNHPTPETPGLIDREGVSGVVGCDRSGVSGANSGVSGVESGCPHEC